MAGGGADTRGLPDVGARERTTAPPSSLEDSTTWPSSVSDWLLSLTAPPACCCLSRLVTANAAPPAGSRATGLLARVGGGAYGRAGGMGRWLLGEGDGERSDGEPAGFLCSFLAAVDMALSRRLCGGPICRTRGVGVIRSSASK